MFRTARLSPDGTCSRNAVALVVTMGIEFVRHSPGSVTDHWAKWENAMLRALAGVVLAVVALAAPQVRAQTVEDFYRGKRLTLTVGYGPGGGCDVFARLLARHLGKFIPGNPPIRVQN